MNKQNNSTYGVLALLVAVVTVLSIGSGMAILSGIILIPVTIILAIYSLKKTDEKFLSLISLVLSAISALIVFAIVALSLIFSIPYFQSDIEPYYNNEPITEPFFPESNDDGGSKQYNQDDGEGESIDDFFGSDENSDIFEFDGENPLTDEQIESIKEFFKDGIQIIPEN